MSRWFRLDDDVVNDPKVQSLPAELFRAWINMLCLASKHNGALPPAADIAFTIRSSTAKTERLLVDLTARGLIDNADGILTPHNWNGRQHKSDVSTTRVKRFRERTNGVSETPPKRKMKRDETVSETAPDTEQNRAETEKKKDAPRGAPAVTDEADYFRRGKAVLGDNSGGLLKNLLKARGSIPLARAVVEQASLKENAREYVAAATRGAERDHRDDHSF